MTKSVVKHPHYLPAALMGGFGKAGIGKHSARRYAEVCMRRRMDPETIRTVRADKIGIQDGLYDVEDPTTELPADFAEQLWQAYESGLPPAIRSLETGSCTSEEWRAVLLHVQAQSIRHPDFDREAQGYLRKNVAATVDRDQIQGQRQRTHEQTREIMAAARFAVLRHREPARRFMINDKGYVPLHDVALDVRGVIFPLSGLVAVAMVPATAQQGDDYENGPFTERTLNAKGMAIVNEATWDTVGIKFVVGHPDDEPWIAEIETGPKLAAMPALGPYRGNREPGLFDWALPGVHLALGPKTRSRR